MFVYWRRRLGASEQPHRLDEAVKDVAQETGGRVGRPGRLRRVGHRFGV
jgi:hypothetical protein